jgi:cytochrome c556
MRVARVMLGVAVLVFVTGVVLLMLAPGSGPAPPAPPGATVRQLMLGLVIPSSTAVFESVSYVATLEGVVETAPRTHQEWEQVSAHAAAVGEAGQLLASHGRAQGQAEWERLSLALGTASAQAVAAAAAQDAEALMTAGASMVETCEACHTAYVPGTSIR